MSRIKRFISVLYLRLCSKIPLFSIFYYVFFDRSFFREQHGVIMARKLFLVGQRRKDQLLYELRRGVHRIEKGLIMKPRRSIFAEDYILDSVVAFRYLVKDFDLSEESSREFVWFRDVLSEYFAVVGRSYRVRDAEVIFLEAMAKFSSSENEGGYKKPYVRKFENDVGGVEYFEALCDQRRSVRWFEPKQVDRAKIDRALSCASMSPSACNRQPYEYRVYDDPDLIRKVASVPMGTKGFYENFPCIVVVVGRLDAFPNERDRHLIYIDGSLSAMTFVYALELQGLSSCIINWPDIHKKEKQLSQMLKLEPYERPIMFIALGYPDKLEKVPFSQKRDLEDVRVYNKL